VTVLFSVKATPMSYGYPIAQNWLSDLSDSTRIRFVLNSFPQEPNAPLPALESFTLSFDLRRVPSPTFTLAKPSDSFHANVSG